MTLLRQIPNFIKQSRMSVKYIKLFIQFLHEELKRLAIRFYNKRMLLKLLNSITIKEGSEQQETSIKEVEDKEKLKRLSIYFSAQEENEAPFFAEEEKLLAKEEAKLNRTSVSLGKRLFESESSNAEEEKIIIKKNDTAYNKRSFSKFNYFNDLEDSKDSPEIKEAALKHINKIDKPKYVQDECLLYPYPSLNDSGEFDDQQRAENTVENASKPIVPIMKEEEAALNEFHKNEKDTIPLLHKPLEDALAVSKKLEEEGVKDGESFLKDIGESARIKSKLFSFYEVDGVLTEDSKKDSEEKTASEAKPDNEVVFSNAVKNIRKEKEGQEVEGRSYSAPMKPVRKDDVPSAGVRGGGFSIDEMGEDDLVFPMKTMGESDLQIPIISLDSEEPIIPPNLVKVKENTVNFNIAKPFRPFSGEQSELDIRINQEDQKEIKVLESDLYSIMEQNTKLASKGKGLPAVMQSPIQAKESVMEDSYKEVNVDIDESFSSDSEKADEEIRNFLSNPMHILPLLTTMTIN
eukprot:TRINITY_DN2731_c0_g1_i2.p1 TRINITY_DN2731_c0_g1~~TRINITY_DN2731_c0_g1_i2.p1  ORF type:complete len:519 (+),score=125.30 TRINITY_DN2731_c0_g1_i2:239-1795(+)